MTATASRILVVDANPTDDSRLQSLRLAGHHLDVVRTEAAAAQAMVEAGATDLLFHLVVIQHFPEAGRADAFIRALAALDVAVSFLVTDARVSAASLADILGHGRLFVVDPALGAETALVQALLEKARTERIFAEARENLAATDRAYHLVAKEFQRQNSRLIRQDAVLEATLDNMLQGLCMLDAELKLKVFNRRMSELLGYAPGILTPGMSVQELVAQAAWLSQPHRVGRAGIEARWLAHIGAGQLSSYQETLADSRILIVTFVPLEDGGWLIGFEDATARIRAEQALAQQHATLDAVLANMSHGVCMFGPDKRIILCNAAYATMYGLSPGGVAPGALLQDVLLDRIANNTAPVDVDGYVLHTTPGEAPGSSTRTQVELRDGRTIQVRVTRLRDGGSISAHEDISEIVRAAAQIEHMACHDGLTGLPNRTKLREKMTDALARVRRGERLAVLCLDLDFFKAVNDTLGHPVGDLLLQAVTARLQESVRDTDTVARLGGDEFIVLQVGIEKPEQAGILARRLIETLSTPFDLDGNQVVIGASVGIAFAPSDGSEVDSLLKNADMALYRAKSDGRGTYRFFEMAMDTLVQHRRHLELDLRRALLTEEFIVYYQPLVSAETEKITGFEALVRWKHPVRGLVSPAEFIPLAEEIGLIVPLGEWVVRQACKEAAKWPKDLRIAVNLSPAQFKSKALVLSVITALAESGISPRRLELEITETVLLTNNEATLATLHQLRSLGVRIAMDDFGTGYSSLSYLRAFPFDKIKIDRTFIQDLGAEPDCLAIVKAVAGLGSSLGMATTAEGVETLEQLRQVREQGCTEAQGYYFSPPLPAGEVLEMLRLNAAAAVA